MSKKCKQCQEIKDDSEFNKDKSSKDGLNRNCKICSRKIHLEYNRKWSKENPEKIKGSQDRYYQAHREESLKRSREYRQSHKEKMKELNHQWRKGKEKELAKKSLQWRMDHLESEREKNRQYHKENQKRVADRKRKHREANPEKYRLYRQENQEQILERGRRWRAENKDKVIDGWRRWAESNPEKAAAKSRIRRAREVGSGGSHTKEEWQALCSYYMDQCLCCGDVPDKLTRDHVIPLIRGGSDDISNIQPLCGSCNSRKHTKIIDYRHE